MHAFVLRVAAVVLVVSFALWVALSVVIVVGRTRYERARRVADAPPGARETRRLLRRAERRARTDWGRWRRITALKRLGRIGHPTSPHLFYNALHDGDPEIAAAAVRSLGSLGDLWATELLITALREGHVSRSRVAAQLERLAPEPGPLLVPLLRDPDPAVRFWGATLLGAYETLAEADLVRLTHDEEPNVRAAAVEALGNRDGRVVAEATVELLDDPAWFVRVHAARSAGHVAGAAAAPQIAGLLADERWWVRTAAKDALRGLGGQAIPALTTALASEDRFARNGAAEVLQDIGLVDHLALEEPESPLLARIYAAGGPRLREAAEARAERARDAREAEAA